MSLESKTIYTIPGERIQKSDDRVTGGDGTYTKGGYIYASLAGIVNVTQNEDNTKTVAVIYDSAKSQRVPSIGSVVTCKVLSISPLQVRCAIHCIDDCVLRQPFRGIIRKEDIQLTNKESTEIYKCFRPGDVIIAKVFAYGENHSFLLSTAENELGVISAHSDAGVPMVPISLKEMKCPKTHETAYRKVAKIVPEKSSIK